MKKGGAAAMEEITDNAPRTISFEKEFAEPPMRVGEELATRLSENGVIKIEVFEFDREKNEEVKREELEIDLSCFLFPKSGSATLWEFDKCS